MMNTTLKSVAIAASTAMLLGIYPVKAGVDAVRAEAYFNAISGGNAETITSFYADDAEFHWIGGPLAGVYKGKDKIKTVWEKFAKAAGELDHEVLQLSESANGKTSTVTALVKFKGEGEVPVKFIMVYKDGKIASEVWKVERAGTVEAKADAKGAYQAEPVKDAQAANKAAPQGDLNEAKTAAAQPAEAQPAPAVEAAKAPEAEQPAAAPAEAATVEAPEGQNAQGAQAAPAAPAPDAAAAQAEKAEPKGKYAQGKKRAYGEYDAYGYEKKAYKLKKVYRGHYSYDHSHGGYGYGGYGGYGHGGYGRGYGHY
jgi:ketosteroid isomerase-like protein